MVGELLEVRLLLGELLLELEEPLLLALADGVVLVGAFAALEGVAGFGASPGLACGHFLVSNLSHRSRLSGWPDMFCADKRKELTHP